MYQQIQLLRSFLALAGCGLAFVLSNLHHTQELAKRRRANAANLERLGLFMYTLVHKSCPRAFASQLAEAASLFC
jgi:hypothetical protein